MLDVVAIHLQRRVAYLSDGREVPITNLFDHEGAETDDEDEAAAFVCGADREWFSAPLSDFTDRWTVH